MEGDAAVDVVSCIGTMCATGTHAGCSYQRCCFSFGGIWLASKILLTIWYCEIWWSSRRRAILLLIVDSMIRFVYCQTGRPTDPQKKWPKKNVVVIKIIVKSTLFILPINMSQRAIPT